MPPPGALGARRLVLEALTIDDPSGFHQLDEQRLSLRRLGGVRDHQHIVPAVDAQVAAERLLAGAIGELNIRMRAGGTALESGRQRVAVNELPPVTARPWKEHGRLLPCRLAEVIVDPADHLRRDLILE